MPRSFFLPAPGPHLAHHRYRYAILAAEADQRSSQPCRELWLADERQDSVHGHPPGLGFSTGLPVKSFTWMSPDGEPQRRWHYDHKGNPLDVQTWQQDYDGSFSWMYLEWIADYTYSNDGYLLKETCYHSAEVWGETLEHEYDHNGFRCRTLHKNMEGTRTNHVTELVPVQEDDLCGYVYMDRYKQYKVLYSDQIEDAGCWQRSPGVGLLDSSETGRPPWEACCKPYNPLPGHNQSPHYPALLGHVFTLDKHSMPIEMWQQTWEPDPDWPQGSGRYIGKKRDLLARFSYDLAGYQ